MNDKDKAFWVKEPDLVEVVRCKDCKHLDCGCTFEWELRQGDGEWEDLFCCYGERRTDG
jgi:hypothetical protein